MLTHRRRSGWNSEGDAWRAPRGDQCQMEWSMGSGVPSAADYGVWGASWAPPAGSRSPGQKRILAYFEVRRTLLFVPIWQKSKGTICISVPPTPNSGGLVPASPRDLRSCAHVIGLGLQYKKQKSVKCDTYALQLVTCTKLHVCPQKLSKI